MSVWRRACLGERRASLALLGLWLGMTVWLGLIACLRFGWPEGGLIAWSVGGVAQSVYWIRRRLWDRWVRTQCVEGIAAVEVLLRLRGHGTS